MQEQVYKTKVWDMEDCLGPTLSKKQSSSGILVYEPVWTQ